MPLPNRAPAPIYIPSKGRASTRLTMKALDALGLDYRVIVEGQEFDEYAAVLPRRRLLVLDPAYQRDYDACDDLGFAKSKGPGPARNFAWDHARDLGAEWHWVMDDNIEGFYRLNHNLKTPAASPAIFLAMEDFSARYANVAMAGPNYFMFASRKSVMPPFVANTRIYSCNLIRTGLPFRWRARYNEDTDLSLRMLKAGFCTLQFNAFLQGKVRTSTLKGGNTTEFYDREGTLPKSRMLVNLHPDVTKLVWRFKRWHHLVDYRPFKTNKLIPRADYEPAEGRDDYGMKLVHLQERKHADQGPAAEAHEASGA